MSNLRKDNLDSVLGWSRNITCGDCWNIYHVSTINDGSASSDVTCFRTVRSQCEFNWQHAFYSEGP